MLNRTWPVLVVLLAAMCAGCGDDARSDSDGGGDGSGAKRSNTPGPPAGGTLTDDMSKPIMSIPRVRPWEEYAEQYQAEHGEAPPEPRGRMEIYDEDMALPKLYLTQSGARVIAAGNRGAHRDAETGEQCWPAVGCYNPECLQRGADGEPFGFIDNWQSDIGRHCPACRAQRDVASETPKERDQWAHWVRPHELADSAASRRELTEQRRRRIAWERAHR